MTPLSVARTMLSVGLAALLAPTTPAAAACFYETLTSGQFQASGVTPHTYTFSQTHNYWTAVAVRPFPGTDWDIRAYADTPGNPGCPGSLLASSVGGVSVLDFVVGDFNHNPTGTYHVTTNLYSGNGIGIVEWDDDEDQIPVNGPMVSHYTHEWDPIQVWDVFLTAGTAYSFTFLNEVGLINTKIFLFGNPANAPYWTGRSGSLVESSNSFTYTPSTSDWYGVVVTNESGYRGNYSIGVGSCTPPVALSQFVNVDINTPNAYFSFGQAVPYWTAVGVRSPALGSGADWDIGLNGTASGTPPPTCFGGYLANSAAVPPRADFVVGDFNWNAPGTYYVRPYVFAGTAGARVDWDSGQDQVQVNGPAIGRNVTGEVLEVWDVLLNAGTTYTIHFTHPPALDSKLLIFQNPGGQYFAGRGAAVFETSGTTTFTPTSTQFYGLIVVHDGDAIGENFFVAVSTCPPVPALASGTPVPVASPSEVYRFTQYDHNWSAVGVRSTSNWDLQINTDPSGAAPPTCASGTIAGSFSPGGGVDFAVGDFNHNLRQEYHVTFARPSGSDGAVVEFDGGSDLTVDAPPVERTTGPNDVLETFDVFLNAGQAYNIHFTRDGAADARFYLYRSFNGSMWGFPSTSELTGTSSGQYTAPESDWYGIVVVNDNGASGSYEVGVQALTVAVDPEPGPARSRLQSVGPNPSAGPLRIEFELAHGGSVEFDVVDLAGRVVARVPTREWAAGRWAHAWDGRGEDGRRLSAGVYFVRMRLGGTAIGSHKLVIVS
jgi:hypothetical protein